MGEALARRLAGASAGLAACLLWPGAASACAVCGSSQSRENQIAYLATTGFLTFLPLMLVAGLVLWIRKRSRELEREAVVPPLGSDPVRVSAVDSSARERPGR